MGRLFLVKILIIFFKAGIVCIPSRIVVGSSIAYTTFLCLKHVGQRFELPLKLLIFNQPFNSPSISLKFILVNPAKQYKPWLKYTSDKTRCQICQFTVGNHFPPYQYPLVDSVKKIYNTIMKQHHPSRFMVSVPTGYPKAKTEGVVEPFILCE